MTDLVNIEVTVDEADIESTNQKGKIRIMLRGLDVDEVVGNIGHEDVLAEIGKKKCREYWMGGY